MTETPAPARPSPVRRLWRRLDAIFWITVALPTLAAALYYGLWASDVYISESRFVVRSPQRQATSGLGALLGGTGFARAQDDTYSVHDYLRSRDALRLLDDELKLRERYADPALDPLSRFPRWRWDDHFEGLHEHYLRHVELHYEPASSITTVRVRAYQAEDAQAVNARLLKLGEGLLERLNERSRRDLVAVAQREVTTAEARAKDAALALASFRAKGTVFDPNAQSALQLQAVAQYQAELNATEAQLAQLLQLAPRNPQVAVLRNRVASLKKTIAAENAKVTGGRASLATKSPDYDRLLLEKTFAEQQLAGAAAALETARGEALRKHLYLERLVQPGLPDAPVEPRRLRAVLTVLVVGLLLWGVVGLVTASVREHVD